MDIQCFFLSVLQNNSERDISTRCSRYEVKDGALLWDLLGFISLSFHFYYCLWMAWKEAWIASVSSCIKPNMQKHNSSISWRLQRCSPVWSLLLRLQFLIHLSGKNLIRIFFSFSSIKVKKSKTFSVRWKSHYNLL